MTVTSKFLCCKYIYLTLSSAASSEVQRCWCSLPTAARVFYSMNIHYIRLAQPGPATYSLCCGDGSQDSYINTWSSCRQQHNNSTTMALIYQQLKWGCSLHQQTDYFLLMWQGARGAQCGHHTWQVTLYVQNWKIITSIYNSTTNRFFHLCHPS